MTAPTIPASESVRQKQPAQQSNQPEQPRRKHDRLITRDMALVMLATFCFMSSNMLANPIVAGYAESLGADGMLMGAVAGSMSFISLFCRPIAGNLSDKTSKRTLVAVGTVLYFAAGLLYYFANSPIMLIMARVINGVGFACCSVCLATWMSLLLPIRHMGAGMGVYGTMNALAMAVGPALGIRAQKYIGYRLTFLSSLVLAVIIPRRNSPVESAYAALEALLKSRSGASHWFSALNASHCTTPQSASTQKMFQMRLSRQFPHGTLSI